MTSWKMPMKPANRPALSHILIADADAGRVTMCVAECMGASAGNIVLADDGEKAMALLVEFGPPKLLVIDLTLPGKDGFSVIEALRLMDEGRSTVFAWSTPEMREFARHRLAAFDVRLLRATTAAPVFRSALESLTRRAAPTTSGPSTSDEDDADDRPERLAAAARKVARTRGVAVYLHAGGGDLGGHGALRAFVDWNSSEPMPASPDLLPQVAQTVLETGETVAWADLTTVEQMQTWLHAGIRGVVAVPVIAGTGAREGAIVLFDSEPLDMRRVDLDVLRRVGAGAPIAPVASIAPVAPLASRPIVERPREPLALASRGPADREEPPAFASRRAVPMLADRVTAEFAIEHELARMRRERMRLSVVVFDMTRDAGEPAAAALPFDPLPFDPLAAARDTLTRASRGSDLAVRWDGDRLLLVLPGLGEVEARRVAERLRASMQAAGAHRVDVSGGVAELGSAEEFDAVVAKAVERLRIARAKGPNRIA